MHIWNFFDKIVQIGVRNMGDMVDNKNKIDYDSFLSDDCLNDFLKIIKRVKAATKEENNEMFIRYQNGEISLKDTIVKKNLSLVVSIAFRIGRNLNAEEKLEYIQSGIIGLIEAVDKFDLSKGTAFSTHAEYWIQMRINRYRYNNQRLIRRPEYLETVLNQYRNLKREYEKTGESLPERSEICKLLNITDSTLKRVEEDYKLDATSLDSPVKNDDQDSDDLGEFIRVDETGFDSLLDSIVIDEIIKTIKMNLSDYEYFIFYYRMISHEQKTLNEIGNYFGITKEGIRLIEEKVKNKIKSLFDDNRTIKRKYIEQIKRDYPFDSIKIAPCPLENYTMYFFLRDRFMEKDSIILREILLSDLNFDSRRIATQILESTEYVETKRLEIEMLVKKTKYDIHYNLFHSELVKKYKNKIYRLDLNSDLSEELDLRKIITDYWQDRSYEETMERAMSYNLSCDNEMSQLIKRFYGYAPKKDVSFNKEHLERDVNYCLFDFPIQEIPINKLYPVFLANQEKFTAKQKDYLNVCVFKKEKIKGEVSSSFLYSGEPIMNKLILLYYNIEDYKNDNFGPDKYFSIRTQCLDSIDERGIKLLDLYYGFNGNRMVIREMAEFLNEDPIVVETDFRRSKNNAIALYLGTTQYSYEKDRDIYASVLRDDSFSLGSPHIEVAKMFFLEGKSYDEIVESYEIEPKFTQRKVAELIKYACSAMDYYRFGITSTQKNYSNEFLLNVLNNAKFDDDIKEILLTYIETRSSVETAKKFNRDLEEVRNIIRRLNNLANKVFIEQVEITKEDVEFAVMEHESINVLNERERIILSLVYGLKNKYNPSGKKKYSIDIAEMLGIKNNIGTSIRKAKEHVAAHKIGLLKTAIDFIDRDELENILRDKRLPITEEDKNIIIDAYGLYDTQYLTIQEIADKYGLKGPIARKRLYKGIITIKKYLNKEIDGNVLFEVDIEPYLKYFVLEDRKILTLLYRDNLTQLEIQDRCDLSTHQFNGLMQKIRMHLSDLRSGLAHGIDFDYFWSNALENDIPFYGNQQLAVELCFWYYEKRFNQTDIIKCHHPELSETSVNELIRSFTTAVIKHQNGIRKANDFTLEEVIDYYNRNGDKFGVVNAKIYRNYFEKVKRNGPYAKLRPNKFITFDLIKDKYEDYFKLSETDSEQVKEILGKCGHLMPKDTIHILESLFGVTHANLLSDEEWEKLIQFLGMIQLADEHVLSIKNMNLSKDSSNYKLKKQTVTSN